MVDLSTSFPQDSASVGISSPGGRLFLLTIPSAHLAADRDVLRA